MMGLVIGDQIAGGVKFVAENKLQSLAHAGQLKVISPLPTTVATLKVGGASDVALASAEAALSPFALNALTT